MTTHNSDIYEVDERQLRDDPSRRSDCM